eukprot:117675_1
MTESNKLEKWLKDNNLSTLLDVDTLRDNGIFRLSDFNETLEDESDIDEFIQELNIDDESDIKQFKNALSILSKTNGSDSSDNKEINEIDNNETETETKISHGDDSDESDGTRTQNIQYKALLKNGTNIVASKKREYVVSKLEEKESAYKGGNGYNKQVLIKT